MFSRRSAQAAIGAIVAVLLASAVAVAATTQTFSQHFSVKKPGKSTGLTFTASATDPTAPGGAPTPASKVTLTLPKGTKINTGAVARCGNPASCPTKSRVGTGFAATIVFGTRFSLPVTAYNRAGGLILTVVNPLGPPIVIKPTLSRGVLTITVPPLPSGAVLSGISLTIPKHGATSKAYITTPKTCPASHTWPFKARFDYQDGTTKTLTSKSACSAR